ARCPFYPCCRSPRAPPPFPTRRSSDLARVLGRGAAADDGGRGHGCLLVVRRPAGCGPAGPVGGPRRGPCFDLPPRVKPFSSENDRKNRRSSVVRKEWRVSL